MNKQNLLIAIAIFFLLLCFAFSFNEAGLRWFWRDLKEVAIAFGIISLLLFHEYFQESQKLDY